MSDLTTLIEADVLAAELSAPSDGVAMTVLDIRWRLGGPPGRNDYDSGHIPGAVFVDLDIDLCGEPGGGGRHPLPDPATLQGALRAAGVDGGRPVVVYDAGDGMAAARGWWTLRWAGHPDVRVLDGGYLGWLRGRYPISPDAPAPVPGDFVVRPGGMPVLDAGGAAALARVGGLIDARAANRYRGEVEPVDPIAGHIPGAGTVPYADLVSDDGRLRSADELRERFAEAGIREGTATGAYCGSGVAAAHSVLAMSVAGIGGPALYVGSWSQWITDPRRPIATGTEADPTAGSSGPDAEPTIADRP